jgi:hypothetical protein
VISFIPLSLYPRGKNPRHPWAPVPVWTMWSRDKSLSPDENQIIAKQHVSIPTELSRLLAD